MARPKRTTRRTKKEEPAEEEQEEQVQEEEQQVEEAPAAAVPEEPEKEAEEPEKEAEEPEKETQEAEKEQAEVDQPETETEKAEPEVEEKIAEEEKMEQDEEEKGQKEEEPLKRPAEEAAVELNGEEEPPLKKTKCEDKEEETTKCEDMEEEKTKCEDKEEEKTKCEDKEEEKVKKRSPDLAKFWKAVEDDSTDFTGWTYLLQFVDTTGDIEDGREAYDAFLNRYPYCYGYWKKYADLEKRKGTKEKCMMVFERGIAAIPLSADLWIHYLNHVRAEYVDQPEFVRAQYERAVEGCGREWKSDKLWDHYVKWETSQEKEKEAKSYPKVLALYDRILQNPTQGLSHQFDMFKEFIKAHHPKDVLAIEDFLALRKEVLATLAPPAAETAKDDKAAAEDEAPGEAAGGDTGSKSQEEENTAMKEKIIFARKKYFKETEEKVQLRWKYEDAIKRPYFHMKPLERGQLKNWNEYLEWEENQVKKRGDSDHSNLEILYERCMIACALYEEFWIKYVQWLLRTETEERKVEEKVRHVYHRACSYHLPEKVEINLAWAAFEEQVGNVDKAGEILTRVQDKHPHLISVMLRRINLERRRNNVEAVHSLYKACIDKAKDKAVKSELAVKYSRFLRLHLGDNDEAVMVLEEALLKDELNPKLYLQLLDIYLHDLPVNKDKVLGVFERALTAKGMPGKHKLLFSQRRMEFMEDFCTNVKELLDTKDKHQQLTAEVKKAAAAEAADVEKVGSGIETIEGRGGKSKSNGSSTSTTTYAATNSASYDAAHNSSYQQYGSRYSSQYPAASSASYGQYNNYYQNYYQGSGY